ncbi:MAG: GDSL-type esterase/lipase family protein [Verrucomicrobiales bacterium]
MFHHDLKKRLFSTLILFCFALSCLAQTGSKSQQLADGRIIFSAEDATLNNPNLRREKEGSITRIVGWQTGDSVTWSYKPTRWGMYLVVIACSPDQIEEGDEISIELPGKILTFVAPESSGPNTLLMKSLGTWYLEKEAPFQVKVTAKKLSTKAKFGLTEIQLQPAREGPMPKQEGNEPIALKASQATTHSVTMRYEPAENKNCLGYWVNTNDWAEWQYEVKTAGSYQVELLQGCGKGHGGSDVEVIVSSTPPTVMEAKSFHFVVEDTGHFQNFIPRKLGTVDFPKPGLYNLAVKPRRKQGGAVMDIRQVNLNPAPKTRTDIPEAVQALEGKKVVVMGDSITHGGEYIEMVEAYLRLSYPTLRFDIFNIGLPSETVSGLSEPGHAGGSFPRPILHERLDRALDKMKPDLIVACYGMNDGIYYPFSEERFKAYTDGILKLRQKAEAAGAQIIHLTPPVFDSLPLKGRTLPAGQKEYKSPYEGYDEVLHRYSEWLLAQKENGWEVIDLHGPMSQFLQEQRKNNPGFAFAGDGVHANTQGNWIMAREILKALGAPQSITSQRTAKPLEKLHPRAADIIKLIQQRHRSRRDSWIQHVGHKRPGMSKGNPIAETEAEASEIQNKIQKLLEHQLPGKPSAWHGHDMFQLEVDGKPVQVVAPKKMAEGKPWVWHGEFFGHKPNPDIALLERGFHIVYMSVPDMLGSPTAVQHWNNLYTALTENYGFSKKPALVGLSRGGLYCYNWAAANPDKVACIYGDAPVCDFKSWPGGFGKGKRSDRDWDLVLKQWNFKDDAEAKAYTKNPVDNLKPLAEAKVPLLHVFGDADEVVPWDENTGLLAERYKAMGGNIELIRKPGVKHHPHGLDDSTPITEFIVKHTATR